MASNSQAILSIKSNAGGITNNFKLCNRKKVTEIPEGWHRNTHSPRKQNKRPRYAFILVQPAGPWQVTKKHILEKWKQEGEKEVIPKIESKWPNI
jgi:hypothetical protein